MKRLRYHTVKPDIKPTLMNLANLKIVLNSSQPDNIKRAAIISILAEDKQVIPLIMDILEQERIQNKELLSDMNLELSRSFITITDPNFAKEGAKAKRDQPYISRDFVIGEIKKFYLKWHERIKCCFQIEGLP